MRTGRMSWIKGRSRSRSAMSVAEICNPWTRYDDWGKPKRGNRAKELESLISILGRLELSHAGHRTQCIMQTPVLLDCFQWYLLLL